MKKIVLASTLLLSNISFAATYSSGLVPFNGTYNLDFNETCVVDGSTFPSIPPITSTTSNNVGYFTFTPDGTKTSTVSSLDAYNKWIASVNPLTGVGAPVFSQVIDPTKTTVKLIETPIQWGPTKDTHVKSFYSEPYTSPPTISNVAEVGYLVITKYTFSNSALNNGIATGYRAYSWSTGNAGWEPWTLFPNAFSTSPTLTSSTNILGMRTGFDQQTFTLQTYTYNCIAKAKLSR